MRSTLSILILALALPAVAQTPVRGDSLRITAPALGMEKRLGLLVRATSDSLTFIQADEARGMFTIANSAITRLQVNYDGERTSNAGKGATIGAIAGGALGLAVGLSATRACSGLGDIACGVDAGGVAEATVVSAAGGALLGTLIGLLGDHTTWRDAKPGSLRLASMTVLPAWNPTLKTVGLSATVRF